MTPIFSGKICDFNQCSLSGTPVRSEASAGRAPLANKGKGEDDDDDDNDSLLPSLCDDLI